MDIESALKLRGRRTYVVSIVVESPDMEHAGWRPELNIWKVRLGHSDGQYGGGVYQAEGPTMELAIDAAVAKWQVAQDFYP